MTAGTVADRLGIRRGSTLWFSPIEWLRLLGPLPPGVRTTGEFASATVAVLFVSNVASVDWFFRRYGTVIGLRPTVWICVPSQGRSDFNRAYLTTLLAGHALHAVAEVPVDGSWTALRMGRA